jgi:hypothetical protein
MFECFPSAYAWAIILSSLAKLETSTEPFLTRSEPAGSNLAGCGSLCSGSGPNRQATGLVDCRKKP